MSPLRAFVIAGLAGAGLLAAAPSAHAQNEGSGAEASGAGEMRLEAPLISGVTLQGEAVSPFAGYTLDAAQSASLSPSQGAAGEAASGRRADGAGLAAEGDNTSASALPWYEQFTLSRPAGMPSAWGEQAQTMRFSAGERWGFTVAFAEAEQGPQFQLQDVSAGAFFELNERIRLGGELRFASPEGDVFGEAAEDREPELKFESAFRF